ncbi:MAG: helix-turn-helix domain-containing protein [Oscillospiraceae bacterium]
MTLRIRAIREDKDLMQKNLANYLGCTQQTYSRYETGELEPSLIVMEKLAIFYGTSIDYLMGLTDDNTQNWTKEALEKANADELVKKREIEFNAPKTKRGRKPKNPVA